jgi:spoIIIJ-associated protein
MDEKTYIFEGKTTNEAIEKGLKELKVSKSKVDIKVLENEEKRSFFSILAPRVVKVEMKLKEHVTSKEKEVKKVHTEKQIKSQDEISKQLEEFVQNFISNLPTKDLKYTIKNDKEIYYVDIDGKDAGYLIGYRGDVLNSLQNILNNIVTKNSKERLKVILNIGNYRNKREKDLEVLAEKIANTVVKTKKSITLEPMSAYERKIIHTKLQENEYVKTYSIGEEPHRKVVVELK